MSIIKKRLISVINVLEKNAVQSRSFNEYLPIGSPEILVENLSRWGSDEILIQCFDTRMCIFDCHCQIAFLLAQCQFLHVC